MRRISSFLLASLLVSHQQAMAQFTPSKESLSDLYPGEAYSPYAQRAFPIITIALLGTIIVSYYIIKISDNAIDVANSEKESYKEQLKKNIELQQTMELAEYREAPDLAA